MNISRLRIPRFLRSEADAYGLRYSHTVAFAFFPFLIVAVFMILGTFHSTRPAVLWTLRENRPVELLTFIIFILSSVRGFIVARQMKTIGESRYSVAFISAFSFLLFLIAMEEVAWGQWIFGFESPDFFQQFNKQGETTLHNIGILQGNSEFFRFSFGVIGIIGVTLLVIPKFRNLAVPLLVLPYILIITLLAGIDLYGDFFSLPEIVDRGTARLSEVVEMLIAISTYLYLSIKSRILTLGSESREISQFQNRSHKGLSNNV